jgi:integrase
MAHSNRRSSAAKAKKPRPDFPLFPHATGRWAKKVRGKFCYFGKVSDDPKGVAALDLWREQKDDLLAGRVPQKAKGGITLHGLCNLFIDAKDAQRDAGELSPKTHGDYQATCELLIRAFGKNRLVDDLAADDFEGLRKSLAKRLGPHALGRQIVQIKTVFKYGYETSKLGKPMRYGPAFKPPAKRVLRAARQAKGPMMFEAREIRRLLKAASPQMRAMILLGINCGFGNHDCGTLPISAVDTRKGWINYPRPKTAIERRCPLWPETVEALQAVIEDRPKAKKPAHKNLVFITKYGDSWAKETSDNPVAKEFTKLARPLGLMRKGRGFYALRHTFETIGGDSRDQVAVNAIMGHADASMAAIYRERIEDQRLLDVVNHVRRWLFRRDTADLWQSRRERKGGA